MSANSRNQPTGGHQALKAQAVSGPNSMQLEMFSGPLPHPEIMKQYVEIGYGDKLIAMLQEESMHRRACDIQDHDRQVMAVKLAHSDKRLGSICAFILSGATLYGSVQLAIAGHDWVAGTVAVSTLGLIVNSFIQQGKRVEKQDNQE